MAFRLFVPLFLLFFGFLYTALLNPGDVEFYFASGRSVRLPFSLLLMGTFAGGAMGLALVHLLGGLGDSVEGLERLLASWKSQRAKAGFGLAEKFARRGDERRALHHAEKVLAADPGNYGALMLKGDLLRRSSPAEALGPHSLALSLKPGPAPALALAEDYRAARDFPAAARCLSLARAKMPAETAIGQALSALYLESGEFAKAVELRKEMAAASNGAADANNRLAEAATLYAEALLSGGDPAAALEQCGVALDAAPGFLPAMLLAPRALKTAGDARAAVERLRDAFRASRNSIVLAALDKAAFTLGGAAESLDCLAEASGRPLAALLAALRKIDAGDHAAAAEDLAKIPAPYNALPVCLLAVETARLAAAPGSHDALAAAFSDLARERERFLGYRCGVCGETQNGYFGQCPACAGWNTAEIFIEGLSPSPAPFSA